MRHTKRSTAASASSGRAYSTNAKIVGRPPSNYRSGYFLVQSRERKLLTVSRRLSDQLNVFHGSCSGGHLSKDILQVLHMVGQVSDINRATIDLIAHEVAGSIVGARLSGSLQVIRNNAILVMPSVRLLPC
jgi:hypothetical protein